MYRVRAGRQDLHYYSLSGDPRNAPKKPESNESQKRSQTIEFFAVNG